MTTREHMIQTASRHPTLLLCQSLEMLDARPKLDEAERLTRGVLIDVLCERHPEADAAFSAWADSDDSARNAVTVITAAARKAAAR